MTSASDLPEPALTATCGITAGGCKIQVQVSGTRFSSCAIWVFRHFLFFFVSSLSSLLALVERGEGHGMFAGPNHLRQSLVILDAVCIESLLSESDLTPFMLHLKET